MVADTEDIQGKRVRQLADHDEQLRNEISQLGVDQADIVDLVNYLTQLRDAWVDFHQAAALIRNYYIDDDNEGKLTEFMLGAVKASDRRLKELELELNEHHQAIANIRMEIKARREELR